MAEGLRRIAPREDNFTASTGAEDRRIDERVVTVVVGQTRHTLTIPASTVFRKLDRCFRSQDATEIDGVWRVVVIPYEISKASIRLHSGCERNENRQTQERTNGWTDRRTNEGPKGNETGRSTGSDKVGQDRPVQILEIGEFNNLLWRGEEEEEERESDEKEDGEETCGKGVQ